MQPEGQKMDRYQQKDCLESDWKKFRKKVPVWQEAYMQKLTEEYRNILDSDKAPSEKFWALEKSIAQEKQCPGVMADMRRSRMRENIVELLRCGAITRSDLEDFSQELQDEMDLFIKVLDSEP